MANEIEPVEFYGKDETMDNDKELLYCEDCESWKWVYDEYSETEAGKLQRIPSGCRFELRIEPKHPIKPKVIYGDYRVLNEANDCPHHKARAEGLGLAGKPNVLPGSPETQQTERAR